MITLTDQCQNERPLLLVLLTDLSFTLSLVTLIQWLVIIIIIILVIRLLLLLKEAWLGLLL